LIWQRTLVLNRKAQDHTYELILEHFIEKLKKSSFHCFILQKNVSRKHFSSHESLSMRTSHAPPSYVMSCSGV